MKQALDKPIVVTKEMQDITAPEIVEILIRNDGLVIWVNVDSVCRFRACKIKSLVLNDDRNELYRITKE